VDVERRDDPGIDERSRANERPPVGEVPTAERQRRSKTVLIGLILVSVTLAAVAQLTLKHGMNVVTGNGTEPLSLSDPLATVKRIVLTPSVWIGLMIFAVSAAVWLLVLSRVSLSFAYPFASLTYVLILVFDRFVLHQPISGLRYAGVALIIAGLFLISRTHTVA
jgi:drug/metabolite transporter (DMT)-like permease